MTHLHQPIITVLFNANCAMTSGEVHAKMPHVGYGVVVTALEQLHNAETIWGLGGHYNLTDATRAAILEAAA